MKIPVYEQHDGEAINGFTMTTKHRIRPTVAGISERLTRVTLRKVPSRHGYMQRSLPANYKTLSREQVVQALQDAQYGWLMVSIEGNAMIAHHNIQAPEYEVAR